MKTLILIRGLHFKINGTGPKDWRLCYESLKENYIKYFKNHEIDIYFQTYSSPELKELINTYKPKKYIAYEIKDLNKHNQIENIYNLLCLIENPLKYDQILLTRFDLIYKLPVVDWCIDNRKLMIPFQHPNGNLNDCIYVFPGKLFDSFKSKLKDKKGKNLHSIKFDNVQFMFNKKYYSDTDYPEFFPLNNNPLYILHRKRMWGFKNKKSARKKAIKQGWIK